jgi:hypothetical protein
MTVAHLDEQAPLTRPKEASALVRWSPRLAPLSPSAVVAKGQAAHALARRLSTVAANRLSGVVSGDILLVVGEAVHLPWADGVCYLGKDPSAPSLLLPTNLQPSVAPALLERAISRSLSAGPPPIAVLPFWPPTTLVISVGLALPINEERLRNWLRGKAL